MTFLAINTHIHLLTWIIRINYDDINSKINL